MRAAARRLVRWSPYIEELDNSNSSSFDLMLPAYGSVWKEDRCSSPVRDLVSDGAGSRYVVPAVHSYISSNGEKNKGEQWDGDDYLYPGIIPGTHGAAISYALGYKKMNGDCSCQECKRWC